MDKIRDVAILILIILLIFQCNKPVEIKTRSEIYHSIDTIVEVDTFNHTNLVVDKVVVLDTIVEIDTVMYGYALHEYHYKINDSLLNATIIAKSPFKPDIDFTYNVKSFTIKDSTHITEKDLRGFFYGGSVSVSPLLNQVNVGVAYQFKKGDLVDLSIGRDLVSNTNIITLGYKKRF